MDIYRYTTVVDEFGDPLKNAHLIIQGGGGTTTQKNGFAQVEASGDATVRINYVGMQPQAYKLIDLPKKITLKMETLDQVTVTGKKKDNTPKYLWPAIGGGLLLIALMSFGQETKEITL